MTEHIPVSVKDDFLARQTKADPIQALSELIWNSLDAEASSVRVEFEHKDLAGGMSKIFVTDNGNGFSREDAKEQFGNLGGSWKRQFPITPNKKRRVHGQEGRGRYKAFALGGAVEWKVVSLKNDKPQSYSIRLLDGNLKQVELSDELPAPGKSSGVIVEIRNLKRDFKVFTSESGLQELAEIFALYLTNYRDVSIEVAGNRIDPSQAILDHAYYDLPVLKDETGKNINFSLDIVEWKGDTKRNFYFCNNEGFPLSQSATKIAVGDFSFSAYIKSSYIMDIYNQQKLELAEMDVVLKAAVDSAKAKIREHFRRRAASKAKTVVDVWKQENIYPFQGEAASVIEKAERQVFDILAVSMSNYAPEFESADKKTKALNLRMLRHAIETSPNDLKLILNEVLQLPKKQQKDLADLLQETSLSAIITAAKTVADRLRFLSGLEYILFNSDAKAVLKERSQLHKILAENTWIFGEQYNLWVSDKSLTTVLRKHRDMLDPSVAIDEPVKIDGKKTGIVDLMFSTASRRHRPDDIENLVVELKAPAVKIGAKEITQIERYAFAINGDERFKGVAGVRWHFWVISDELDDFASQKIDGGPNKRDKLTYQSDRIRVGLKTWGELIEENKARLQFFQEHLQYTASEDDGLRYLQERHKEYLEGVINDSVPLDKSAEVTESES